MIMPYLNFQGNCEEAFLWYEQIFDGKLMHMSKYKDMPQNAQQQMSEEQKAKVMHAQLMLFENGGISGADALWPVESGSTVSIQAHFPCEAPAQKVFAALAKEGSIIGELVSNPPPDDYGISGSVKDKYGFTWIISALKSSTSQ